jgi:hypothetical protein
MAAAGGEGRSIKSGVDASLNSSTAYWGLSIRRKRAVVTKRLEVGHLLPDNLLDHSAN